MGNEQGRQLGDDELKGRQIQQMDWEMKRKLARGVDFNMRVVIRGDRSTGKSCLFNRLQGKPFIEEYIQTSAIQISSIHWNYKVTDDIIKVEVWDVVDVAKKKRSDDLKVSTGEETTPKPPQLDMKPPTGKVGEGSHTFGELDARTIDVYKGTHAVVFLFDPSKKWTWEYIEREAPNVPENIPICVLANFKDSLETIVVTEKVVRGWLQSQKQTVVYLEASMKNCYGLIGVKTFLNLPFLKMQRDGLLAKLARNKEEISQVESELEVISKEQSYEDYLKMMDQIKLNKSTSSTTLASGQNTPLAKSTETTPRAGVVSADNTPRGPDTAQAANPARALSSGKLSNSQPGSGSTAGAPLKKAESVPEKKNNAESGGGAGGFFSKIFNKVKGDDSNKKAPEKPKATPAKNPKEPLNVTEYAPGDAAGLDAWLGDDDVPAPKSNKSLASMAIDDDDDDEVGDVPSRPAIAADDDGPDEDTQTNMSAVPMRSGTVAAVQGRALAQPTKPKTATPAAPVTTSVPAPAAKKSTPTQPTEVKATPKTSTTAAPTKTATAAPVKVSSAPIKTPTTSNPSSKPTSGTTSPASPKSPSSPVTAPKNSNNAAAAKTATITPAPSQPKTTTTTPAPPKPAPTPAPKKTPVADDSDDDLPAFNPLVARDEDSDEDDFYAETTSAKPAPSQRVTMTATADEDETGSKSGSPLGDFMIDDYLQPREEDIEWVKKFEQAKPAFDFEDDTGVSSGGQYSDDDEDILPRPRTEDELERSFYSIDSSPQVRGNNNTASNQQSPPGKTMPSGYEAL